MMVVEIKELETQINQLREGLVQIVNATGLDSNEPLRPSRKSDELITIYQKSKHEPYKKFE
jgi:hypothetical protein